MFPFLWFGKMMGCIVRTNHQLKFRMALKKKWYCITWTLNKFQNILDFFPIRNLQFLNLILSIIQTKDVINSIATVTKWQGLMVPQYSQFLKKSMTKVIYYRVVSTGWLQPDLLDTDLINSFNKNIFLFQIEKKPLFKKQ